MVVGLLVFSKQFQINRINKSSRPGNSICRGDLGDFSL